MDGCTVAGTARLNPTYDDVLDVLKGLLAAVPVDEDWYMAEYPAVADFVFHNPGETATLHFRKHGYFERRRPFAPGWRGLVEPVAFIELKPCLNVSPRRGRIQVDIERGAFLALVTRVLRAVPVDERWYLETYPAAARSVEAGTFGSATDHYAHRGYFEGWLPFDMAVDADWYVSRYDHVRIGLACGVAGSAKDHFIRVGYHEGCRPTPP